MAIPTNQTPATAIAMTLDYAATQIDIDLATPVPECDVWYSYTASAGEVAMGFWASEFASANYTPTTTVWTGPIGSLTQYLAISIVNKPMIMPVTPGTTYYFRIRNSSGVNPTAVTSLAVSALRAPAQSTPAGSIFINDDTDAYPAAILSVSTGATLAYKAPVVAGEAGDVLPTGEILLENSYDTPAPTLNLYDAQMNFVQEIDIGVPAGSLAVVRTHNPSGKWYVGSAGSSAPVVDPFITTINADGTMGPTTWNIGGVYLFGLAANNDETILYYTGQGSPGAYNAAVKRWDLVNDIALSDLASGVAGYQSYDTLVLADDTVLQLYRDPSPPAAFIRRYSTAGAVLNTYTLPGSPSVPRLAYAIDPLTFWVMWAEPSAVNPSGHLQNLLIADGSTVVSLPHTTFTNGFEYYGVETATPTARFGRSNSCPLIVLRSSATPIEPIVSRVQSRRRVRVFPHLSEEQVRAFHKALQIDMETGVGLGDPDDPEGYTPSLMLRWSDDGGHTWSNVHERTLGRMGQYQHRVIYRQLGMSRDRLYEISLSDPVRAYVIAGYLDAEAGIA